MQYTINMHNNKNNKNKDRVIRVNKFLKNK